MKAMLRMAFVVVLAAVMAISIRLHRPVLAQSPRLESVMRRRCRRRWGAAAALAAALLLAGCSEQAPPAPAPAPLPPPSARQLPRGTVYYQGPMARKGDVLARPKKKAHAGPTGSYHAGVPVE